MELREMIGKDLAGYSVEALHEVFRVNDDGKRTESVGYFRSEDIANAFAGNQRDASWYKVRKAFLLTNGSTDGFLLSGEPVTLFNDEEAALAIRAAAIAKLSPAEQRVLKL